MCFCVSYVVLFKIIHMTRHADIAINKKRDCDKQLDNKTKLL